MSIPVKTVLTPEPMPLQMVSTIFKSVAIDVSTKFAGTVYWDVHGDLSLWVESSQKAAGNDTWVLDQSWYSSILGEVFASTQPPTIIPPFPGSVCSTYPVGLSPTGFSADTVTFLNNCWVFMQGTVNEFHYITSVNAGGFGHVYTTEQAPTPGIYTVLPLGVVIYDCTVASKAQRLKFELDFSTISRVRFVVQGSGWSRVALTTLDSVS